VDDDDDDDDDNNEDYNDDASTLVATNATNTKTATTKADSTPNFRPFERVSRS